MGKRSLKNRFNDSVLCEYESKRDNCLDRKKKAQAMVYNAVCNFVRLCPLTIAHIKEEAFK